MASTLIKFYFQVWPFVKVCDLSSSLDAGHKSRERINRQYLLVVQSNRIFQLPYLCFNYSAFLFESRALFLCECNFFFPQQSLDPFSKLEWISGLHTQNFSFSYDILVYASRLDTHLKILIRGMWPSVKARYYYTPPFIQKPKRIIHLYLLYRVFLIELIYCCRRFRDWCLCQ